MGYYDSLQGSLNEVKDYSSGAPIQISVYENKIYFWNDGQLPENWTVKKLLSKHASKPFNPLIANSFFRAGMIESWGRGIEKIKRECESAGVPIPEYSTDMSGLMVKFNAIGKQPEKMSEKVSEKTSEKILGAIRNNKNITIAELAKFIGITPRSVERHLKKLQTAGQIQRIGPDKGGHWIVKDVELE